MKKLNLLFLLTTLCISVGYASDEYKDTTKSKVKVINFGNNCEKINAIYVIIKEAIASGAPTYNEGNHLGCYLIYEGAAYKILYKYGSRCMEVTNILEAALEKSYGNYSTTDKAWIMRMAFDTILGEPTKTK